MNPVLRDILDSRQVTDGTRAFPLTHPDFPHLAVPVDAVEGAKLQEIVARVQPVVSLEIGLAYGVSALFICEALARLRHRARHIICDPFQSTQWRGIGLRNLHEAGFEELIDFHEERSELQLPRLLAERTEIDFALVDGWHTFDQVMMEFYFLNRMLRVGGVIAFDDADRRSVNRVIRHALTYPCYRVDESADSSRPPSRTLGGRVRRSLRHVPGAKGVVRPDFLSRDWDMGILGSCVAIQKIDVDARSSGWDKAF
jgi:predicted O-methyltransferase YrrM